METAKDYDMIVAAHAHGDEGIQRAVRGGVKTIEHGTLLSDESMRLMIEYGTYLVPTMTAGKEVAAKAKIPGYYNELVVPKALAIGPKIQNTTAKAYRAGVNIAFGSDAGVFSHGKNAKEFRYMNEAGIPVIECLQAATIVNSKILSVDDEIGQIKEGFTADIIANIFDRIVFGSVTDFLYINLGGIFKTGIFNIADLSVTTGMILILISSFKRKP